MISTPATETCAHPAELAVILSVSEAFRMMRPFHSNTSPAAMLTALRISCPLALMVKVRELESLLTAMIDCTMVVVALGAVYTVSSPLVPSVPE